MRRHWLPTLDTAAVGLLVTMTLLEHVAHPERWALSDFVGTWCSGALVLHGIDPYATGPLLACQHGVEFANGVPGSPTVMPVAYPQPVLSLFALFATMPYLTGMRVFAVASAFAYGFAVWALARVVALPWWAVATLLAFADFTLNLDVLGWPPFELAAASAAAAALRSGRPRLAGALVTLTFLQPSIGLPAVAATIVWVPRARAAALAGTGLFAALALALGPNLLVEDLTRVIPSQALGELTFDGEYSLSWLCWLFGAPDAVALRAGALQYAAFACGSIAIAGRVARSVRNEAAVVFVPMAAATALGSYSHLNYFLYALPLGLLLAASERASIRVPAWLALLALTRPIRGEPVLMVLLEIAVAATAARFAFPDADGDVRLTATLGTLVLASVLLAFPNVFPPGAIRTPSVRQYREDGADLSLASARRGFDDRERGAYAVASARVLAVKSLSWGGILLLLTLSWRATRTRTANGV